MVALPKSLSSALLLRPNTTLLAATRYLTPDISTSFFHLPRHDTSLVIPVQINLFSQYDAAGAVRGLHFAGVTHVDAVVFGGGRDVWSCGDRESGVNGVNGINGEMDGGREYEEGLRRLLGQVRMFLRGSRVVVLGEGEGMGVSGVREMVMAEVGDVASFFHV